MIKTIIAGDISKVESNAIITAINSSGMWFGGIDGVIQRVVGNHFHSQASNKMPIKNEDVIFAKGKGTSAFENVIFVVDDLQSPLRNIIYNGLIEANKNQCKVVSIPAIRTGVMLGEVEKNMKEAVHEIATGIKNFENEFSNSTNIEEVIFVVYQNPDF